MNREPCFLSGAGRRALWLTLGLAAAPLGAADAPIEQPAPAERPTVTTPSPIRLPAATGAEIPATPGAADVHVAVSPPLLGFLVDFLYSQGAWTPGDLQVPYGPGVAILLSDLAGPEEAKALDLKTVPAALQENFRQAEMRVGAKASAAYLAQLNKLAGQLPVADQSLAGKVIAGMCAYQTAMFRPNRLFPAVAPANQGYRREFAPAKAGEPEAVPAAEPLPPAPAPRAGEGPRPERPAPPATPPLTGLEREQAEEAAANRGERAANEAWMKSLSVDELARVTSCLASRRRDLNAANYYDRTLRLFIGRAPVRLSDLFDASLEFRRLETTADAAWKQELANLSVDWQKEVLVMRKIAAQEQAAKMRVELRPGLMAVLKLQFDDIEQQQALQHQYETDMLALAGGRLSAEEREVVKKRAADYPGALRKQIEALGEALEAAWTDPLEEAFVRAHTRARRIEFVRENLHPRAKPYLDKQAAPAPNQGGGENPDQF